MMSIFQVTEMIYGRRTSTETKIYYTKLLHSFKKLYIPVIVGVDKEHKKLVGQKSWFVDPYLIYQF